MKAIFIILFAFIFSLLSYVKGQDTIYIPLDYSTIQQGIDASSDDDLILVDTGTYMENINFNGKAIILASNYLINNDTNCINNTIIDGSEPTDPNQGSVVTLNSQEDTTSVLCGFTITGGSGTLFIMDQARSGGGILCYNAGATIKNNHIISNQINYTGSAYGGGIALSSEGSDHEIIIENNRIQGNQLESSGACFGAGIYTSVDVKILDNIISSNHILAEDAYGSGISAFSEFASNSIYIENNLISGNIVEAANCNGSGFYTYQYSVQLLSNSIINNLATGDQVRGSGGYLNNTVGVLLIKNNDISYNESEASSFNVGIGLLISRPANPVEISGNSFTSNTCSGITYGGACSVNNEYLVEVAINNNIFKENNIPGVGAGAALYTDDVNYTLMNNLFSYNVSGASGGAICIVTNPKDDLSAGITPGNEFHSDKRVLLPDPVDFVIINNTFAGNSAINKGGAIRCTFTTERILIMNSIFWENVADIGPDVNYEGTDTLRIYYSDIDSLSIDGDWIGVGNIFEDPMFMNPANGDFCIDSCGSPCVAAGKDSINFDNTWYYSPLQDLRDLPRPFPENTHPDMGAYEVNECPNWSDEYKTLISTLNFQTYPNPTNGICNLKFTINCIQSVTVRVFDSYYRELIMFRNKNLPAGEHTLKCDVSMLPPGVYLIKVCAASETAIGKMVIQ